MSAKTNTAITLNPATNPDAFESPLVKLGRNEFNAQYLNEQIQSVPAFVPSEDAQAIGASDSVTTRANAKKWVQSRGFTRIMNAFLDGRHSADMALSALCYKTVCAAYANRAVEYVTEALTIIKDKLGEEDYRLYLKCRNYFELAGFKISAGVPVCDKMLDPSQQAAVLERMKHVNVRLAKKLSEQNGHTAEKRAEQGDVTKRTSDAMKRLKSSAEKQAKEAKTPEQTAHFENEMRYAKAIEQISLALAKTDSPVANAEAIMNNIDAVLAWIKSSKELSAK